ncbi:MAG: hypothetical protein ACP5LM_04770 [Thermoplasmata archaeon]
MNRNQILQILANSTNTELANWAKSALNNDLCWVDLATQFNSLSQPARITGLSLLFSTNDPEVCRNAAVLAIGDDWPVLLAQFSLNNLSPASLMSIARFATSDAPRIAILSNPNFPVDVRRAAVIQTINKSSILLYVQNDPYLSQFLKIPAMNTDLIKNVMR